MNPVLQILACLALFLGLVFGLGLPLVARWPLRPAEKICAGAALGMTGLYLFALARYWLDLPAWACVVAPVTAAALVVGRRRECLAILHDPAVRRMLGAYLLIAGWCLGFLALVRSYSGGGWALDWADHYDRARFFLRHWPVHTAMIYGGDQLTTRPPLANAITSVFLALTSPRFPFFQIFTTLASTLAFLPVWLLAGRFARAAAPKAQAVVTLLFMLNPSVMENSTFAWTKLVTVFFILSALYLYLPALTSGSPRRFAVAFFVLAAGFLAHYSAGPYAVALVAAYFIWQRSRWRRPAFWRNTVWCALPAALLLASWFGWAFAQFGVRGTLLSNTSVTQTTVHSVPGFFYEKGLNLLHTLIPHPFRPVNHALIAQTSRLGYVRDYFFLIYQVNLPFMFGSVGGLTLLCLLWRAWRRGRGGPDGPPRTFWLWFSVCTVVLGCAAYGGIDDWGVAHLCLQSLLGLGLAYVAARIETLPRWWRALFAVGVAVDFILGVGLQFYLENSRLPASLPQVYHNFVHFSRYSVNTWINLWAKMLLGYKFLGDWPIARPLLLVLLACLFALALLRAWRVDPPFAPAPESSDRD